MKILTIITALAICSVTATAADLSRGADNFYASTQVTTQKVTFKNQYQMTVAGNLFIPKNVSPEAKLPAIIVGHPMGAVKEQSANLYAQKIAEYGYITLSLDLSFWGESEGQPRNAVLPDLYSESFSAAVDFLGTRNFVDRNRIGVIGICGSGSFAISAAKIDPRLKAIATISMYDMGAVTRNGLKKSQSLEQREEMITKAAEQRYVEFLGGETKWVDYLPLQLPENSDATRREFYDYYRTPRGQAIPAGRTLELTQNRPISSEVKFVNFYPFNDIETISPRPMLFIAGETAHSLEFSEDAYKRAAQPKELYIVPNAGHVDLYDRVDVIPFGKLDTFFRENLK
jgi:fermentation-respiration switch protein FrsA (DUF1100 family)